MSGIYSITPFTMLDYPNETACIVWFSGCNLRCPYCHNPEIVFCRGDGEGGGEKKLFDFLEKRRGLLGGVVLSGGEATTHKGLAALARRVRSMGFKVKLDTNGSRPQALAELFAEGLPDYAAVDYKANPAGADIVTGVDGEKYLAALEESLKMLISRAASGAMGLEVRTTFHPDLMDEEGINEIIRHLEKLDYRGTYYLQQVFSYGGNTLGNIRRPEREIEAGLLIAPKNFHVSVRNAARTAADSSLSRIS